VFGTSLLASAIRRCKPLLAVFLATPHIAEAIAAIAILGVALAMLA
jgi:hypothetical protein